MYKPPETVVHLCSQQGHRRLCCLGLHVGGVILNLPLPCGTSSLSALLLGANSASTDACQKKRRLPRFLLYTLLANLITFTLREKARPIPDPGLSCSHPLDIALGSSRYGNGDGECVLSQQQADKACGVWREPASGTSPWRYTHTGPRLIPLPPACHSAPAHSPTGAHPKTQRYGLQKILQNHSVCGIFFPYIMHFSPHTSPFHKNTACACSPKSQVPETAALGSRGSGTLAYLLNTSPAPWGSMTCVSCPPSPRPPKPQ